MFLLAHSLFHLCLYNPFELLLSFCQDSRRPRSKKMPPVAMNNVKLKNPAAVIVVSHRGAYSRGTWTPANSSAQNTLITPRQTTHHSLPIC